MNQHWIDKLLYVCVIGALLVWGARLDSRVAALEKQVSPPKPVACKLT